MVAYKPHAQSDGLLFGASYFTLADTPAALPVVGPFAEQWPVSLTVLRFGSCLSLCCPIALRLTLSEVHATCWH